MSLFYNLVLNVLPSNTVYWNRKGFEVSTVYKTGLKEYKFITWYGYKTYSYEYPERS